MRTTTDMTGEQIRSRDGKLIGTITKDHDGFCGLEGCRGHRVSVRWPDGRYTYPCSRAIELDADGVWKLS